LPKNAGGFGAPTKILRDVLSGDLGESEWKRIDNGDWLERGRWRNSRMAFSID